MHTYIHAYIHTYMHVYIHTYIHTRRYFITAIASAIVLLPGRDRIREVHREGDRHGWVPLMDRADVCTDTTLHMFVCI